MLFGYIDEAYDSERYRLVAVVVDVNKLNAAQQSLRDVLAKARQSLGVHAGELHAHDLFHGRGAWNRCLPRQRIGIYDQALSAIADHRLRVVIVGLNREPQPTNNWPATAHHQLMGRLTVHLDSIARTADSHVLLVADDHHAHAGMRDEIRTLQLSTETRVVDTLHFVPSHAAPLVQAADLVAYLVRRIPIETDLRAQRANERLLARISQLIEINDISAGDAADPKST